MLILDMVLGRPFEKAGLAVTHIVFILVVCELLEHILPAPFYATTQY